MLLKKSSKQNQGGFTLIEVSIAAAIAGMVAAIGLYYQAQDIRYKQAYSQVDQLRVLGNALKKYESTYFKEITANTAVAGVVSVRAPTVDELKALGILDTNFSDTNFYANGKYRTKIRTYPTGCAGTNCSLFGIAHLTTAVLTASSKADPASAGAAIKYGGSDFAVSHPLQKATLKADNGAWSEPNPMGSVAGILAMRVLYTEPKNPFNGAGATADLSMNGYDLTDIGRLRGAVGEDLEIQTANGKDMYLQNLNDTPSSNLYANFKNSTFTQDVTVNGTLFAFSGGTSGYAMIAGGSNGQLTASPKLNTGSLNVNDVYLRSVGGGKWASDIAAGTISTSTTVTIGKVASQSLGTHKFCVLSGSEASFGSTVARTYQWVTGTVNGPWTYNSNGAIADYAQVTCFD